MSKREFFAETNAATNEYVPEFDNRLKSLGIFFPRGWCLFGIRWGCGSFSVIILNCEFGIWTPD